MRILTTEQQLELLGAAWRLEERVRELAPDDWKALAAAGTLAAAVFPSFAELTEGGRRLGLPEMTRDLYDSLLRHARDLASPAMETQH